MSIAQHNVPHSPPNWLALSISRLRSEIDPDSREDMPWREWIDAKFSAYTTAPMAPRHERVWEWAATLQPGVRTRPVVECWPRGSAKSTTAELVCTYLADSPSLRR